MRVVFDTNVLLSLWVFFRSPRGSQFAPLRGCIASGRIAALSNPACLAEFERVLAYPEFRLTPEVQRDIYMEYRDISVVVPVSGPDGSGAALALPRCRDRDDQKFLELARDGVADALVTGDKALLKLARHRLLGGRFLIVTPLRFMTGMCDCGLSPQEAPVPHRPG